MYIYQYDAFSNKPNKGNPAGVVFDADNLSEKQMQEIAKKVGFNETAFICKSEIADIKLRYFTPGHEMNLCGHGTVASLIGLYEQKSLKDIKSIETKAGIIDAEIIKKDSQVRVKMKQISAQFIEYEGETKDIANILGLEENEIDISLPIVYGSTGIWTLIVPIQKLSSFKNMKPKTKSFPKVLKQKDHSSIHPFCLETVNPNASMHGRHFSSAFSGTVEDSVTGTACGVMGAYHLKYISKQNMNTYMIEQGLEIDKEGNVIVNVNKSNNRIDVEIEGTGVFVKKIEIIM